MILNSLTNSPKHYYIEYNDFNDLYKDYIKLSNQMDTISEYNPDIKTQIDIIIGEHEYLLSVKIWKK